MVGVIGTFAEGQVTREHPYPRQVGTFAEGQRRTVLIVTAGQYVVEEDEGITRGRRISSVPPTRGRRQA